jgi:hypothetical protein
VPRQEKEPVQRVTHALCLWDVIVADLRAYSCVLCPFLQEIIIYRRIVSLLSVTLHLTKVFVYFAVIHCRFVCKKSFLFRSPPSSRRGS